MRRRDEFGEREVDEADDAAELSLGVVRKRKIKDAKQGSAKKKKIALSSIAEEEVVTSFPPAKSRSW